MGDFYMADELKIKLYAFTLDCRDPYKLAKFYAALLGWEIAFHDGEFACVGAPGKAQGAYPGIMFQRDPAYEPPIWPQTSGTGGPARRLMRGKARREAVFRRLARYARSRRPSVLPVLHEADY